MGVISIDGAVFKHQLKPEQLSSAFAHIKKARSTARQLRKKLKPANGSSATEPATAVADFMVSDDIILAAAIKANMGLDPHRRATLDRCLKLPLALNVKSSLKECARVRPHFKKSGGYRVIHDFGLQHRTAQTMVGWVMERHFVPRAFQFTFRGLHRAIVETKQLLQQGLVYYATLDINDHFGSFDPEKLAPVLPLPKEWVDHVVVGRHLAVVADQCRGAYPHKHIHTEMLLLQARQGIPQGSVCSPIVAAYSVAHLPWASSMECAVLNYSDNFLLLASSATALKKSIDELKAAVGQLPGGQFRFTIVQRGHASEGLDFLGHRLRSLGSCIRTSISPANQESLFGELRQHEKRFRQAMAQDNYAKTLQCLARICAHVKGWITAFRECDDIAEWESPLLFLIQDNAGPLAEKVPCLYSTVGGHYKFSVQEYALIV